MTQISCSVENCKYNELSACVAQKINVSKQSGNQPHSPKETECDTFVCGSH